MVPMSCRLAGAGARRCSGVSRRAAAGGRATDDATSGAAMARLHRSANDILTAGEARSAGAVASTGDILTTEDAASTGGIPAGDIATDEVVSTEDSASTGDLVSVAPGA